MKREEVLGLVGKELSEAVALHVMGWRWDEGKLCYQYKNNAGGWSEYYHRDHWKPSDFIDGAADLVEMRDHIDYLKLQDRYIKELAGILEITIAPLDEALCIYPDDLWTLLKVSATDKCRAAILACLEEQK